jgi:Xaa-Pro dipeptidase
LADQKGLATMNVMDKTTMFQPIARGEFEQRRKTLGERIKAAGLSGAVAFARQGTASTRAGYVLYLSDYYTPFFDGLEDCEPHWAALGHAAVVTAPSGESLLVTDMNHYYFPGAGPKAAGIEVVHDTNVMRGIATAARKLGIGKGRVGLIGQEILSVKRYALLQAALPDLTLIWNDDLLDLDMMIKSEPELRILRYANKAVEDIATQALRKARPGITEHELVDFGRRAIAEAGGELFWMRPIRLNPLKDGDIYYMSIVASFRGYFVDVARNTVVGEATAEKRGLVTYLNDYILEQAHALKPGITAEKAAEFGYRYFAGPKSKLTRAQIEEGVLCPFPAFGHGIGLTFGKPYIREGDKTVLKPGMVIAIEANYELPNVGVAEAEVTVEIAADGPRLLSGLAQN